MTTKIIRFDSQIEKSTEGGESDRNSLDKKKKVPSNNIIRKKCCKRF